MSLSTETLTALRGLRLDVGHTFTFISGEPNVCRFSRQAGKEETSFPVAKGETAEDVKAFLSSETGGDWNWEDLPSSMISERNFRIRSRFRE
jgi:hypothetical protein